MDADALVAIDVHSHVQASLTSRGFPAGSPEAAVAEVFGSDALLNVPELAAFYRERNMAAVCFMVDTRSVGRTGDQRRDPRAGAPRSRRADPVRQHRSRTAAPRACARRGG